MSNLDDAMLPCPYCGGDARLETPEVTYFIECNDCEAQGPLRDDISAAIAAWNRRAGQSASDARVAELELKHKLAVSRSIGKHRRAKQAEAERDTAVARADAAERGWDFTFVVAYDCGFARGEQETKNGRS